MTQLVTSGMLARHPGLRIIVPHAGATLPVMAARVDLLTSTLASSPESPPPSLLDALRTLHFDLAGAPVPELLSALVTNPTGSRRTRAAADPLAGNRFRRSYSRIGKELRSSVSDRRRVHYASEYPFTPVEAVEKLAASLDETTILHDDLRSLIMSSNAIDLFPRLGVGAGDYHAQKGTR